MKWRSSFVPPLRTLGGRKNELMSGHQAGCFPLLTHPPHTPLLHRTSLSPLQSMHSRLVVATATAAAARPRPVIGVIHLFLSFLAGGIFFGALFAGFTTFMAVGSSNISRLWSIAKSVIHRVWTVFCFGLNETRLALRMDGQWQFGQAWKVFRDKMGETAQAMGEGMDAIKAEKDLYAGVVGQPGLITAQYFLNRLLPFSLTTQMENALKDSLKGVKNDLIRSVVLNEFQTGGVPPELLEARNYELGTDALALDVDVKWESKVYAKMTVTTRGLAVKVAVKVLNPTFEGTARVVMTPLTKEPPGWGAILVSLSSVPKIGLDVQAVGGDLTKVPWLKKEILKGLQQQIQNQLLWPKRIVLPSLAVPPSAKTVIPKKELDELHTTDPLLQKEDSLEQNAALKDVEMKPNVTSVPSMLRVSVNSTDTANGGEPDAQAHNGTETTPIEDKKKRSFTLLPHFKNTTKTQA